MKALFKYNTMDYKGGGNVPAEKREEVPKCLI